jgi:hypothetical protein
VRNFSLLALGLTRPASGRPEQAWLRWPKSNSGLVALWSGWAKHYPVPRLAACLEPGLSERPRRGLRARVRLAAVSPRACVPACLGMGRIFCGLHSRQALAIEGCENLAVREAMWPQVWGRCRRVR